MTRLRQTGRVCAAVAAVGMVLSAAPARAQVSDIAVEADGSIVVVDFIVDAVLRIDPATGAIQTVSDATVGAGPELFFAWAIGVEPDGSLLVTGAPGSVDGILRVDPVSGDRTLLSGGATGGGPAFQSWDNSIAVAPDGRIFVGDRWSVSGNVTRIVGVDPETGDRTVVSGPGVGDGHPIGDPGAVAVEPGGSLACADGGYDAVLRIDPVTGGRQIVSDASTGSGRAFGWPQDVDVEADSTLVVLDSYRDVFCFPLCPHPLCIYCFSNAPTVFRVDPVDGDRTIVSGGGTALISGDGTVQTPFFGRKGRGPDLVFPQGVAVEGPQSFVVTDHTRVVRINGRTGRRDVLATLPDTAAAEPATRPERLQRLATLDPRRVHRPRDPIAWLRSALGDAAREVNLRRPERLLAGLPPGRARVVALRLYDAIWKTMRDVLGADHPDTRAAARPSRPEPD